MKLFLPLVFGVLGALAEEIDRRFAYNGEFRLDGISTECQGGRLDGQIYEGASSHFLCNRYDDGSSYAEIISCKIGGVIIAVGRSVGNFECTAQGMKKNGQFPRWVMPYARHGELPGSLIFRSPREYAEDRKQVAVDEAEAKAAVAAAIAQLGAAPAAAVAPTGPELVNLPAIVDIDPHRIFTPTTTPNPDCDELTGDCYFPTGQPGIKYPVDPSTDIHPSKVPAGNPDCDELTQDCYFPNVPKADSLPSYLTKVLAGNPDCNELTQDCYFPNVPKEEKPLPTNPKKVPAENPDCDELTQDCYFPNVPKGDLLPLLSQLHEFDLDPTDLNDIPPTPTNPSELPEIDFDPRKIHAGNPDCDELTQDCYFPNVPKEDTLLTNPKNVPEENPDCDELTQDCYFPNVPKAEEPFPTFPNKFPAGNPDCDELTQDCYVPNVPNAEHRRPINFASNEIELDPTDAFEIPPTAKAPRPLPYSSLRCTLNGKEARVGQRFIVGDLYVLKCTRVGRKTELRFVGCLTPTRPVRGNSRHPSAFEGALQTLDFPRHRKGAQFECRGEFQPDQLSVV